MCLFSQHQSIPLGQMLHWWGVRVIAQGREPVKSTPGGWEQVWVRTGLFVLPVFPVPSTMPGIHQAPHKHSWNEYCCQGQSIAVIFTGEEIEAQRAPGPRQMTH